VTSSVATLDTPIIITNQPASQIVAPGGTATFTVGATNGLPAYNYQWRFNGVNIAGATASTYSTNNVQVANAGSYTAVITDSLSQSVTSLVAVLTVGIAGNGTGLNGDYYSAQLKTMVDPPTLSRVDPTVNFNFGLGSPDPLITADSFTIRWTGQVQPFYSQTYTFYTVSDDGVRLWVNGQLLVDQWIDQGFTEWSGNIALNANQKYGLVMEYYENAGGAAATLSWSSPNQVKQIIPQTQLYAASGRIQPTFTTSTTGSTTTMTINWSGSYALYSSTDVNGPYNIVTGATSPYVITVDQTATSMFFKLVSQ
jgi:hypothetical protein